MKASLQALRSLFLGETWVLPIGVATVAVVSAALRGLAGPAAWWHHAGGFVVLGLTVAALVASVLRGAASHGRA